MDKYKVSIVCSVFNRLAHLEMLMWNVFEYQDMDSSCLEFIIVDDGSTIDLLSPLREKYRGFNVRYFRTNRKSRSGNPGIAAGRSIPTNIGVDISKGRIVVICDAEDFMLEKNHFSRFDESVVDKEIMSAIAIETRDKNGFEFVKENYKDPEVVKSLVCQSDLYAQESINSALPVPSLNKVQALGKNKKLAYENKMRKFEDVPYFVYRCSGYWAQTRKSFVEMGGFDERVWGLGGDDYELSHRLDKLGFYYVPSELHVLHNYHGDGLLRHYGEDIKPFQDCPDSYWDESKATRLKIFDEINSERTKLIIPWDPKIHDDDVYVDFKNE